MPRMIITMLRDYNRFYYLPNLTKSIFIKSFHGTTFFYILASNLDGSFNFKAIFLARAEIAL